MKTNSQRAKIILERVNEKKQQPVFETENKPAKKKLGWQMITAICVASVVFVAAISGLIVGLVVANRFNLDKMFIANFSSYSAIGVGAETQTSSKNVAFAYDGNPNGKARLVGVNDNNEVEEIKYSKEKEGGTSHEIKARVVSFHSFKDYSIVMFYVGPDGVETSLYYGVFYTRSKTSGSYYNRYKSYLIDNRTGKFYSLDKIGENNETNQYIYALRSDNRFDYSYENDGERYDYCESDTAIYFASTGYDNNSFLIGIIYRAAVEGDELVIHEVFNSHETNMKVEKFFVDRYDNIFLTYGYNHYLLRDKNLQDCEEFCKSVNGIAYHYNNVTQFGDIDANAVADKMVDKNGNIVEADFAAAKVYLNSEEMIKSAGGIDYYYKNYGQTENSYQQIIKKVTWLDDEHIKFVYEEIPLEVWSSSDFQCVVSDDYLYFRTSTRIEKTEITTGKTEILTSDYIFTNIETDNLGNVKFEGVRRSDMSKVLGLIDNEGNISVDITPTHYEVYYIKPLNR